MEKGGGEHCSLLRPEKPDNPKFDLGSRNLKFFKEDIFHLHYDKLSYSSNYSHFQHVFVDADDYEDFKHELINFHKLQGRWKEDRKKVSKERPSRLNSLVDNSDILKFQDKHTCTKDRAAKLSKDISSISVQEEHVYEEIDDVKKQVQVLKAKEELKQQTKGQQSKCDEDCKCIDFAFESLPMMEFFQNDEHFQEFDRVFETVKNKRRYASSSSLDKYRWSPHSSEGQRSDDSSSDTDNESEPTDVFPEIRVDDIFSDFFSNDADFKKFEEEFENFQFKRHSSNLQKWHRTSVCDLIEDLKAFCDSDEKDSKTNLSVENKLSLPKLWSQGGEWEYIFSKIRPNRNVSSVTSDTCRSDLTVTCDSESGNYLLDDVSDISNRDAGYNSEAKFDTDNPKSCTSLTHTEPGKTFVSIKMFLIHCYSLYQNIEAVAKTLLNMLFCKLWVQSLHCFKRTRAQHFGL